MSNNPYYSPYRQSKSFGALSFGETDRTFVGLPIEDIKATNKLLDDKYHANKEAFNKLQIMAENIKVDEVDDPLKKHAIERVKSDVASIRESGKFEFASNAIMKSTKDFVTDQGLRTAMEEKAKLDKYEELAKNEFALKFGWSQDQVDKFIEHSRDNYRQSGGVKLVDREGNELDATNDADREKGIWKGEFKGYMPGANIDVYAEIEKWVNGMQPDAEEWANSTKGTINDPYITTSTGKKVHVSERDVERLIEGNYAISNTVQKYFKDKKLIHDRTPEVELNNSLYQMEGAYRAAAGYKDMDKEDRHRFDYNLELEREQILSNPNKTKGDYLNHLEFKTGVENGVNKHAFLRTGKSTSYQSDSYAMSRRTAMAEQLKKTQYYANSTKSENVTEALSEMKRNIEDSKIMHSGQLNVLKATANRLLDDGDITEAQYKEFNSAINQISDYKKSKDFKSAIRSIEAATVGLPNNIRGALMEEVKSTINMADLINREENYIYENIEGNFSKKTKRRLKRYNMRSTGAIQFLDNIPEVKDKSKQIINNLLNTAGEVNWGTLDDDEKYDLASRAITKAVPNIEDDQRDKIIAKLTNVGKPGFIKFLDKFPVGVPNQDFDRVLTDYSRTYQVGLTEVSEKNVIKNANSIQLTPRGDNEEFTDYTSAVNNDILDDTQYTVAGSRLGVKEYIKNLGLEGDDESELGDIDWNKGSITNLRAAPYSGEGSLMYRPVNRKGEPIYYTDGDGTKKQLAIPIQASKETSTQFYNFMTDQGMKNMESATMLGQNSPEANNTFAIGSQMVGFSEFGHGLKQLALVGTNKQLGNPDDPEDNFYITMRSSPDMRFKFDAINVTNDRSGSESVLEIWEDGTPRYTTLTGLYSELGQEVYKYYNTNQPTE